MESSSNSFCYKCYLCNRIFATNSLLKSHLIECKKAPYVCQTCGKRFVRKSGYESHMRSHANQKNAIFCDYCKKKFKERHNLLVHINYYHPEKAPKPAHKKANKPIKTTLSATGRASFHLPAPIPTDQFQEVVDSPGPSDPIPTYEPPTFPLRNESFKEDVLPDIADYFKND